MGYPSIVTIVLLYLAALFLIVYYGHRQTVTDRSPLLRQVVYSLSLGVYISSWSFLGAVRDAADGGWYITAVYLGPILVFGLATGMLRKLVRLGKTQNILSIADFMASRYGKRQSVATMVAVLASLPLFPYLASQIKGLELAYGLFQAPVSGGGEGLAATRHGVVATLFLLTLCTITVGAKSIGSLRDHKGLVLALSAEGLVKILAFLLIAAYAAFVLATDGGGGAGAGDGAAYLGTLTAPLDHAIDDRFLTYLFLSITVMICLPRQFHVMVVESTHDGDISKARWIFPVYLALAALSTIVIAAAGSAIPGSSQSGSAFTSLPISRGNQALTVVAFVGILSASFGMVIVLALTHTTMICNDIVIPLLMKTRWGRLTSEPHAAHKILLLRRAIIIGVMLSGYALYRAGPLRVIENIDFITFVSVTQFVPGMIGGLYWLRGHRNGVIAGLVAGYAVWAYTLVIPNIKIVAIDPAFLAHGPFAISWLRPEALFGCDFLTPLGNGVFWSLAANLLFYVAGSLRARPTLIDQVQANAYVLPIDQAALQNDDGIRTGRITVADLRLLLEKFLGPALAATRLQNHAEVRGIACRDRDLADGALLTFAEAELAKLVGSSVAHSLMLSLVEDRRLGLAEVVTLLSGRSDEYQFNRELLQNTLSNIGQGVCVLDQDLKVLVWNDRFADMLSLRAGLMAVALPVREIFDHIPDHDLSTAARLSLLRREDPRSFDFTLPSKRIFRTQIIRMATGEYVISLTDITDLIEATRALQDANERLEERVQERTQALSDLNSELRAARLRAEALTRTKTDFLAAASHDLLQPLNAARLFTSALQESVRGGAADTEALASNINAALQSAENLLRALLDISKLDAGAFHPQKTVFALDDILATLRVEFAIVAQKKGLDFRAVPSSLWIESDKGLLLSILQNLLTNAVRYTVRGKVLLGCRLDGDAVRIEVWDTGVGIPADRHQDIFREFVRLSRDDSGIGLGLAITRRMARLLGHDMSMRSAVGKGSIFSVTVLRHAPLPQVKGPSLPFVESSLSDLQVLCLDNDPAIRDGMALLLRKWHCTVQCAATVQEASDLLERAPVAIDVILADYHLDDENGLDFLLAQRQRETSPATVLVTADRAPSIRQRAEDGGCQVLYKPLSPAALKALLTHIRAQRRHMTAQASLHAVDPQ